jgi:hypothetical protein
MTEPREAPPTVILQFESALLDEEIERLRAAWEKLNAEGRTFKTVHNNEPIIIRAMRIEDYLNRLLVDCDVKPTDWFTGE